MEEHLEEKKRGFGKGVLVGVCSTLVIVLILGGTAVGLLRANGAGQGKQSSKAGQEGKQEVSADADAGMLEEILDVDLISKLSTISAFIYERYLYETDNEVMKKGILDGLVNSLGDPYSEYYDEAELSSFQDSTDGEYVGIGAGVSQERSTGIVRIVRAYEGTPAEEAGLLPGDILVSVDGTEVTGIDLNQVVYKIKGEEGTKAALVIYREEKGQYLDIEVERRKVEIPTVISEMLEDKIGYIEVTSFDGVTANQFIEAYESLKSQGMERVIVDMRDNGGGLVDVVEEMLDYLLPEGVIFYAKDKYGTKSSEYISDADAALDIPMAVLVNGNTASAAEVFSGNIQAFGKGKVVGTVTFGKGVMQQLFYIDAEQTSAIKLTVADYYIHTDKNINGTGILPDIEVELDEEAVGQPNLSKEQDNQLQKAIETVKGM